jgi:1,4-dihydroxy-2-naphthoate octaprenyltransferase
MSNQSTADPTPTGIAKWARVTRAPFLSATLVPILAGAVWAYLRGDVAWDLLAPTIVGAAALHVAANCFNDYFDWKSGADAENDSFFEGLTGGSRTIQRDVVTPDQMYTAAVVAAGVAVVCGVVLIAARGWGIAAFGLFGLATGYAYTAPPLRLVARHGLGELVIALDFGPLIVGGTTFTLTGKLMWTDLLIGVPLGLLTAAILWANEFPDTPADAAVGKHHLVATLGRETARWGYIGLVVGAFGTVALGVGLGTLPVGALLFFVALPLAVRASWVMIEHFDDPELETACRTTIQMHLVAGLGLIAGLLFIG